MEKLDGWTFRRRAVCPVDGVLVSKGGYGSWSPPPPAGPLSDMNSGIRNGSPDLYELAAADDHFPPPGVARETEQQQRRVVV